MTAGGLFVGGRDKASGLSSKFVAPLLTNCGPGEHCRQTRRQGSRRWHHSTPGRARELNDPRVTHCPNNWLDSVRHSSGPPCLMEHWLPIKYDTTHSEIEVSHYRLPMDISKSTGKNSKTMSVQKSMLTFCQDAFVQEFTHGGKGVINAQMKTSLLSESQGQGIAPLVKSRRDDTGKRSGGICGPPMIIMRITRGCHLTYTVREGKHNVITQHCSLYYLFLLFIYSVIAT